MRRYLNACAPDQPDGPIDQRFQAQVEFLIHLFFRILLNQMKYFHLNKKFLKFLYKYKFFYTNSFYLYFYINIYIFETW